MRRHLFATAFALLSLATLSAVAQPKVIAHRGYWRADGSAQNSVASLVAAAELGCWGSEFDVWLSADGELVLYHDDEMNGHRVEQLTLAQMSDYRLENGEPLPLLRDFLAVAQRYPDLKLIFELKPHKDKEHETRAVEASVKMVEEMGLAHRTEYISFSHHACLEFIRLAPDAKVYYLNGELSAATLKKEGFAGADYHFGLYKLSPKLIKRLHALGLEANVWTVNKEDDMEWVAKHDMDYITTDYPEVALDLFEKLSAN